MDFGEKQRKGLTRRDFMKGTAAGAVGGMVAGAAGTALAASKAERQPSQPAKKAAPEAMCAEVVHVRGHEGDTIDAYLASPAGP
ncbi:MAG: twin-arginine translocation signal domain-containing protein, partial [Deltaproteobacteria bacterium]